MHTVARLTHIPANFDAYIEEVSAGLDTLYGVGAGARYGQEARLQLQANMAHPSVLSLGGFVGDEVAGILLGVRRGGSVDISFLHVLSGFSGEKVEEGLVREAVRLFRGGGVERILYEAAGFCDLEIDEVFGGLGFESIERELMGVSSEALGSHASAISPIALSQIGREDWDSVGACLVAAYAGGPDAKLHEEVCDEANARDFVERVMQGNFGTVLPGLCLQARVEGRCGGLLLGCQLLPSVGFVLQLAVDPSFRGRGLGGALLCAFGEEAQAGGMARVALGVTRANAARVLYERLDFVTLRRVRAYLWRFGSAR